MAVIAFAGAVLAATADAVIVLTNQLSDNIIIGHFAIFNMPRWQFANQNGSPLQARNNARAIVTGSIAMFSNEFFSASLGASRYDSGVNAVHTDFSSSDPVGSRQIAVAFWEAACLARKHEARHHLLCCS